MYFLISNNGSRIKRTIIHLYILAKRCYTKQNMPSYLDNKFSVRFVFKTKMVTALRAGIAKIIALPGKKLPELRSVQSFKQEEKRDYPHSSKGICMKQCCKNFK